MCSYGYNYFEEINKANELPNDVVTKWKNIFKGVCPLETESALLTKTHGAPENNYKKGEEPNKVVLALGGLNKMPIKSCSVNRWGDSVDISYLFVSGAGNVEINGRYKLTNTQPPTWENQNRPGVILVHKILTDEIKKSLNNTDNIKIESNVKDLFINNIKMKYPRWAFMKNNNIYWINPNKESTGIYPPRSWANCLSLGNQTLYIYEDGEFFLTSYHNLFIGNIPSVGYNQGYDGGQFLDSNNKNMELTWRQLHGRSFFGNEAHIPITGIMFKEENDGKHFPPPIINYIYPKGHGIRPSSIVMYGGTKQNLTRTVKGTKQYRQSEKILGTDLNYNYIDKKLDNIGNAPYYNGKYIFDKNTGNWVRDEKTNLDGLIIPHFSPKSTEQRLVHGNDSYTLGGSAWVIQNKGYWNSAVTAGNVGLWADGRDSLDARHKNRSIEDMVNSWTWGYIQPPEKYLKNPYPELDLPPPSWTYTKGYDMHSDTSKHSKTNTHWYPHDWKRDLMMGTMTHLKELIIIMVTKRTCKKAGEKK